MKLGNVPKMCPDTPKKRDTQFQDPYKISLKSYLKKCKQRQTHERKRSQEGSKINKNSAKMRHENRRGKWGLGPDAPRIAGQFGRSTRQIRGGPLLAPAGDSPWEPGLRGSSRKWKSPRVPINQNKRFLFATRRGGGGGRDSRIFKMSMPPRI